MSTFCTSYGHTFLQRLLRRLMTAVAGREEENAVPAHRYEYVMRRYGDMVAGICWAYASVRDDFEDLRQDACMNIYRRLATYRGEAELKTWICRVTLNTCITGYRRRKRWGLGNASLDAEAMVATTDDNRFEDAEFLHSLLQTLSLLDRSLIILWLEEHSYEEIADIMGMIRNTVASKLRRIKIKLAKNATKI